MHAVTGHLCWAFIWLWPPSGFDLNDFDEWKGFVGLCCRCQWFAAKQNGEIKLTVSEGDKCVEVDMGKCFLTCK